MRTRLIGFGSIVILVLASACLSPAAGTPPVGAAAPQAAPEASGTVKVDPTAWQGVIDGQIAAFRKGDAATALSYAGASFRSTFSDPATFMMAIAGSGYAPIFTSVSDSFGKFQQPDPKSVLQEVDFIGPNQELFIAIYQLGLEADGWRVEGVQLAQAQGLGV